MTISAMKVTKGTTILGHEGHEGHDDLGREERRGNRKGLDAKFTILLAAAPAGKLRALFTKVAYMRVTSVFLAPLLFVWACSSAPAPAPAPAAEIEGNLNQVMRGILYPNSNIIFDSQDRDPGATPDPKDLAAAAHPFAGTYGGWEAVENASLALAESANLVALPGRSCANGKPVPLTDPTYQKGVAGLREVSAASYKAAQAKNQDAMLDVADKLTQACSTCHDAYRDIVIDGKPAGIEARCNPNPGS